MMKAVLAAAGLSLVMLALPVGPSGSGAPGLLGSTAALADVDIDVDINLEIKKYGKISCRRGERIVERAGFRRVRPRDCRGRTYVYIGRRHGDTFLIRVNSRRGRIVDVDRI
jgi:hypothetical protein